MNIRRCSLLMLSCFLLPLVLLGQSGTTSVYLKFKTDKIYILDGGQVALSADFYIGTWENPAKNLYASSFDIDFPADLVFAESTSFTYDPFSFLGKKDEVVILNRNPESLKNGRLNISISRNDGKSINGFGKIGSINFVINADIIGGRNVEETPFNIKTENIKLLDIDRNELPFENDREGATITIVNDILARERRLSSLQQIEIYPNPANDQLFIQLHNLNSERIEMINAAGQRVLVHQVHGEQVRVNTKNLQAGLYIVKIHTSAGIAARRVLLR